METPSLARFVAGSWLAFAACQSPGAPAHGVDPAEDLLHLLQLVDREYVREVPQRVLVGKARDAMLAALDPYSAYVDAALYAELKLSLAGSFGGVGMRLDFDGEQKQCSVRGPLLDSPALAAGVRAGDMVETIDGQAIAGLTQVEVLARLRGEAGSQVMLGVRRGTEFHSLRIVRAAIPVASVRGWSRDDAGRPEHLLPGLDVGYLRIAHFASTTAAEVERALAAIAASGARALVVDLRQNQGGLLRSAVAIADLFLDEGTIVGLHRRGAQVEAVAATPGVGTTLPLAILVDGETKSAAEVLAACLQDHRRGVVVGARSFGKGTVQQLFPLADGAAVLLTVEHYVRPSGRPIERHLPDSDAAAGGVAPEAGLALDGNDLAAAVAALLREDEDIGVVGAAVPAHAVASDRALAAACAALGAAVK